MMRKKMSKKYAKRNFRKGARVKKRNFAVALRGGYRI